MTIKDYCKRANVSKAAVSYRLKNNIPLPGVRSIEKIDKVYKLTVNAKELSKAKKFYRKKNLVV